MFPKQSLRPEGNVLGLALILKITSRFREGKVTNICFSVTRAESVHFGC